MEMAFTPTTDELALVERVLSSQKKRDFLEPDVAVEIFTTCGLSNEVLAQVWNLADEGSKGHLLAKDVAVALRLIGWAQAGEKVTQDLISRDGPLATIKGFSPESSKSALDSPRPASNIYPPISPGNREKYKDIFQSAAPQNDVLDNHTISEIWNKSKLSEKLLSRIWNLVNVDQRDHLDFNAFCLGMYFIQGLLDKHFTSLPETLPAHLSVELKGRAVSNPSASTLILPPLGDRSAELKGKAVSVSTSSLPPLMTSFGDRSLLSELEMKHWILHPSFTTYATQLFNRLDSQNKGSIGGDVLVPFLQSSNLPDQELAKIWDLSDISHNGLISRYGFTVVLFLVHRKLAGFEIPDVLPAMLPSPVSPSYQTAVDSSDPFSDRNKTLPDIKESEHRETLVHSPTATSSAQEFLTLQTAAATMRQENDALRSSLKTMSQTLERQKTINASRRYSSLDKDVAEITRLRVELQNRDSLISRLRDSLISAENLGQENALLRVKAESLASQLEVAKADFQVMQILAEEASHESEELRRQVQELRDSTSLPSAGGDKELQMLINEDISRENGRLRNQIQELQDATAQLQAASTELDMRKEAERTLVRENKRLKRQLREMEETASTRTVLQFQVDELTGENERLRRELESARENAQRLARRPVRQETDLPPPSYTEVAG